MLMLSFLLSWDKDKMRTKKSRSGHGVKKQVKISAKHSGSRYILDSIEYK